MWYTMSAGCVTERMQREVFRKFVKWCAEQAREKGREPDFVAFKDGTEYVVVLTGRDGDKRELFAEFHGIQSSACVSMQNETPEM